MSEPRAFLKIHSSFSAPTGFRLSLRVFGYGDRKANKLHTVTVPYPQSLANRLQTLSVGSDFTASAVLGFSIRNMHTRPLPSETLASSQ